MKRSIVGHTVLLFLTPFAVAGVPQQTDRTPVTISDYASSKGMHSLEATVRGASARSRLVVLLKYRSRPGLHVATDGFGEPELPRTMNPLPPADFPDRASIKTQWNVRFATSAALPIEEIYVVVCDVTSRPDSSAVLDYKNFQYLPFKQATDIGDALRVLSDFAWNPTGFTKIMPTN